MCGIAGVLTPNLLNSETVSEMLNLLEHRGPDGLVLRRCNGYEAGMCRLAINGIANGAQPLTDSSGTILVFYNGEIYNSAEMRRKLNQLGYAQLSSSDGEVIPQLYRHFGVASFAMLDGMFAIALWDSGTRTLFLVRDQLGEKPLFYSGSFDRQGIAFASEIPALLAVDFVEKDIDLQGVWDIPTFLWVPEPNTVYSAIKAVPSGSYLRVNSRGQSISRYVDANRRTHHEPMSDSDALAEVRNVVDRAIESRLMSDVPIGTFLSGGVDSSIVSAVTKKKIGVFDTFSAGFDVVADPYGGVADESDQAREFAEFLGTRHHSVRVSAKSMLDSLDAFIMAAGEPFAVSSGLGIMAISRAAQEAGIKVLLSGDCADELFGGYSWYPGLFKNANQSDLVTDGPVSFQTVSLGLEKRLQHIRALPSHEQAVAWHYYGSEDTKSSLFTPDFQSGLLSSVRHFAEYKSTSHWSGIDYVNHDREFYLPNEMLRKLDRMTMVNSVEGRVPFAAPSVVRVARRLEDRQLVKGDKLKWVLKRAYSDLLPTKIRQRPKHGFNVPIDFWLKNEWRDLVRHTFSRDSRIVADGWVRKDAFNAVEDLLNSASTLHGHTIFSFIIINRWLELK